jgi:hypothetical protein
MSRNGIPISAFILVLIGLTLLTGSAMAQPPAPITDQSTSTLDFPRLGMWWPDPNRQSLDDIARYDWVILWNDAGRYIPELCARNPDIKLLNATNACELSYLPATTSNRGRSGITTRCATSPPSGSSPRWARS